MVCQVFGLLQTQLGEVSLVRRCLTSLQWSWQVETIWMEAGPVRNFIIYMGASQNRRSGTSSGTTPVPYPRSIPPFHTSLKDPFHTSVPYLWSIRYYIIIIYIYMYLYIYIYMYLYMYAFIYIYICIFIYIYTWICAVWFYICTRILERTYTHECVHARIGLLCPSPVIVLSSLCLQRLLCDGRDVLGCCQLAV